MLFWTLRLTNLYKLNATHATKQEKVIVPDITKDHSDIVNIGLHFFHKDVRLMLPLVVKHSIVAA